MQRMNELGFYTLAGAPQSPRDLLDEVREGEELGLGSVFISERFNVKEAATLSRRRGRGRRREIGIATGGDQPQHPPPDGHRGVRHDHAPADRRSLLARPRPRASARSSTPSACRASRPPDRGLRRPHAAASGSGEVDLRPRRSGRDATRCSTMGPEFDEDIPMTFTAFAPKIARSSAGRVFDAVVLHTFFTDETTGALRAHRASAAAEEAGRDPASVRVWSCFATVGDHLPDDVRLEEDGRPDGHLPPGLRRSAGQDQRLGPGRAAALPRRRAGRGLPRRARRDARRPSSSSTSRR